MCVGWDWQDWVIAILLPVDMFLVLGFIGFLLYGFLRKNKIIDK
jgi:hypothetical protein